MKNTFYSYSNWLSRAKQLFGAALCWLCCALPTLTWAQSAAPGSCQAGLLANYYRGYFYEDLSFFTHTKPGIADRRVDGLNFPVGQDDNFNVGDLAVYNSPGNPDEFSATYTGQFYALTSGSYTFYLGSDDAASLWFDQDTRPVTANVDDKHSFREAIGTKYLSAGFHTIRVYYGEHGGSQGLVLRYQGPGMMQQVVPNGVLYTSQGDAAAVLTNFELNGENQRAQLSWTTATEHQSEAFVVERSPDGVTFEEVGRLAGAGSSTQPHTYQLIDDKAPLGLNYYRLRQLCGKQTVYSPIKEVTVEEVHVQVSLYPIPNNGRFFLRVQPAFPQTATLELWDVSGLRAYSAQVHLTDQPDIAVSPNVPVGLYTLRLRLAHKTIVQRVVIGY